MNDKQLGNYSMLVNGTVLGSAPIKTSLLFVAAFLSVLFTLVKPEASAGLGLLARFSFWILESGYWPFYWRATACGFGDLHNCLA
jgi:hypothetical protein